ncbi:MAG: YerC/YecD family TrpR-related protein [Xanthomonadales bacterium]|nr:YerC/YecD family TrpR-related protein [Xanthomonadales bacterium]
MKRKSRAAGAPADGQPASLAEALLSLTTVEEMQAFLVDLCTPAELEALRDRWRVVPYLDAQVPYRDIYERTGVSVTTVGRVARTLSRGSGYRAAVQHLQDAGRWPALPLSSAND